MENLASEAGNFYSLEGSSRDRASGENSAESDFSGGEREDLPAKRDAKLGVKRKEKEKDDKKKDKDKGYAALEGESSPDEADMDVKSPFKGKKRSFKFSSAKKEKKKDEEKDKDKKKEKDKEKDKKEKVKEPEVLAQSLSLDDTKPEKKKEKKDKEKKEKEKKEKSKEEGKVKDAKKVKSSKEKKKSKTEEIGEDEFPIFGVALEVAVERCKCHDDVDLPLVVRDCIDFMEENGLTCEGIYRSSGVKTRVLELRRAYNLRETVCLDNEEPPTVASLLKQYLRELPENILMDQNLPKFEEAAALKNPPQQEQMLRGLVDQLPKCNQDLLAWLFTHMSHVVERERVNKMNVQNVSIVLSPTLNLSHRILNALFGHASRLFGDTSLHKYVPPISGVSVQLPTDPQVMEVELRKQESLLTELHREITKGSSSKTREEQLWEAQRIVTQLKRKMKTQGRSATRSEEELKLELAVPPPQQIEKEPATADEEERPKPEAREVPEEPKEAEEPERAASGDYENVAEEVVDKQDAASEPVEKFEDTSVPKTTLEEPEPVMVQDKVLANVSFDDSSEIAGNGAPEDDLRLALEIEERENWIATLEERIKKERQMIDELHEQLAETGALKLSDSSDDEEETHHFSHLNEEEQEQLLADILRENRELEEKNTELFYMIEEQREACVHLRVELQLLERGY